MGTCSSSFFEPQITSKDSKQKTWDRNLETEIDLNSTRSQHFSISSKDSSSTKTGQFKDQNTKEKESFLGLSSDSEETQGTLNKSDLKTSSLKIDQRLNQVLFKEKETPYSSSFETLHSSSVENHSNLKSNFHSAGKEAQIIPQYLGDKVEYKTQNTKEKERYNN